MSGIEITTNIGCRIGCIYCPQEKIIAAYTKRSNMLQMTFDTFKTCVDKIPINVMIYFSGMCEAWLNPDCTKMLLYAHQKGHKVGAFTTLIGMTPADLDLIESIPFVVFSAHLPSSEGFENIIVNEDYLKLLTKVARSRIRPSYVVFGGKPQRDVEALLKKERIRCLKVRSRGRNIDIKGRAMPNRRRGVIGCALNLCSNMLLPNGDVTLCCVDYSMQHILGNLLTSDYESLFKGEEFLNVKKGLRDESLNILCRYCEEYAYGANVLTRFYMPLMYHLKNFYGIRTSYRFTKKHLLRLS